MLNSIRIASTLCIFAAIYLLMRSALATFNAALLAGRDLAFNFDFVRDDERLPSVFRLQGGSVFLLPIVRYFINTNRFGLRENEKELDKLLVRAGLRPFIPPEAFISVSFLMAIICGGLMCFAAFALGFGPFALAFGFISGGVAGYAIPQLALNQIVTQRVSLIEKRLPFAIEFMLLTMEANAAFPAAVEVYCHQFENDPLAEELISTLSDIDKGVSTQEAFNNMGKRIGSEQLSAFILAVVTGVETGQPMKEVLEMQASATRQMRYESAEEIAKKASTKATLPLFLIVVAILLLLLGPILVNLTRSTLF